MLRKVAKPVDVPTGEPEDIFSPAAADPAFVPSGAAVATLRAFDPRRAGRGKAAIAVAIVAAWIFLNFALDAGWIPADGRVEGITVLVLGPVVGAVLRHFGSRWSTQ